MEKIERMTPDITQENIERLAELFPSVATEVTDAEGSPQKAIDFDALRELLGDVAEGQRERYQFTWPGKREAKSLARTPCDKTMRPERERSVNWDTTENLYIEGDNLEALKLLRETYAGKVKLIYIDPPYNTGHDFVYNDSYASSQADYSAQSADFDNEGGRLVANPESNGRFHSAWCTMIYPRLLLARDLLSNDGAIFVSIDDNEQATLKKLLDEVFGPANFLATLIWEKTRKNDARFFSSGHEYILVYGKNVAHLVAANTYWREDKPGGEEIAAEYELLQRKHGTNYAAMEQELRQFFRGLPKDHPAKKYSRYSHIDESGIWRDDNMSWPGGGGPTYDVIHPVTGKPCKVPPGGWRYASIGRMQEAIDSGKVVFRDDETEPPIRKTFLIRKAGRFSNDDEEDGIGRQVMGTYFYRSSLQASSVMESLFGAKVFDYPKDHEILKRLIKYASDSDSLIVDFFSGSASTAHAVMELNYEEEGSTRRFIMVQVPDDTEQNTVASREGYHNLCEIGEERIRRAGASIRSKIDEMNSQLRLGEEPRPVPDMGFRVLRIDDSNYRNTYVEPSDQIQANIFDFVDNLKDERSPEDLLFQVLPTFRIPYSAQIDEFELDGHLCYNVNDGQLIACFDTEVGTNVIEKIAQERPIYAVFRDASLADDSAAANFEELFKTYSPDTIRRVI